MYWTGKGDDGTTKLFNSPPGCRIPKSSRVVKALGSLDEVNSYLGLAKALAREQKLDLESFVNFLQEQLFILQAELAGAEKTVSKESLEKMESNLHIFSQNIPEIKSFSIPGGTVLSAHFDVARTMARRAERENVALRDDKEKALGEKSYAFLNRLSSACFILARYVNSVQGVAETPPSYN